VLTKATNRRWWRPATRGAGAVAVVLAVGACSSVPRHILLPDLPKSAEANSLNVREHQRVLAAYGGAYEDPKLQPKLNEIVSRLTAASERQPADLHYKVTILNSPAVNAFALPNGQLYVTRGLLALANDSAEVASVMSHEMAHIIARHAKSREEQAAKTEMIGEASAGSPQGGTMALARSKIALASFSRSQEIDADTIGVGIAARAGFDPYGASRLLTSMGRNADLRAAGRDTRSLDFMSSHPATPERVTNAINIARNAAGAGAKGRNRDRAAYLQNVAGMKYGDDTDEGFVRGRQFIHPKLGFTFMAPEGFILDNTAEAVLGSNESAGQVLRLDVVKVPDDKSLIEYLNSGWIENIKDGSVEELRVNGNPAATAIASGDPWSFRLYVVKLDNEVYRFIFGTKNRTTDDGDKAFREAIQTFRRLSVREKTARPLHLKVVPVQPGDTIESLAAGMIFADRQIDRFLVLNGLERNAELKPGDSVKIVVE
jgi:predicted Zn-dependent protease